MASIDRLVIQIDGDATKLTKALADAQKRLNTFNTSVMAGNEAINGFVSSINKGASSAQRLASTINQIKTSFSELNRGVNSSSTAIVKLGNSARLANADIKSFASQLNKAAASFERISGASRSATAAINSLQRRVAALGLTVSATNSNMRSFNRTVEMGTAGAKAGGIVVNNYGRQVEGTGGAARRTTGLFGGLNRANITLIEGFRRHVAQITALRTLVYQAAFWFGPLIYSIIKVDAEYETLMQRLKNISGQTTELAKSNWAEKTRQQLIGLANTNPFSLHTITDTFVKMRTVGLDPLNGSLQTLMDSIAYFGGGNQQLANAALALQEMVGKTAVSMKELRRQLGQAIPDAMKSMAEGVGMSMHDFYKAVQHGTVESKTAIANMFRVLDMEHRGAAATMMMTWSGMLARMTTAWQNFVAMIEHHPGRITFIDVLKKNLDDLMVFMNSPAGMNFAISVDSALATVASWFKNLIEFAYRWRDTIVTAAKVFAIWWGGRLIIGTLVGLISTFGAVIRAIILTKNAMIGATAVRVAYTAAVNATAVALGVAATAEEAATVATGGLMAAMGGAIGIAVALAGAIWLTVKAINAQTLAQKIANMQKNASQGGAWKDIDQEGNSKQREARRAELKDLDSRVAMGGYWTQGGYEQAPVKVMYDPVTLARLTKERDEGFEAFNMTQANTRNSMRSAANVQFEQSQPDPYAATKAKFDKLKYPVDANNKPIDVDPKIRTALDTQEAHELAGKAQQDIWRLQKMRNGVSPAQQSAIDELIEKREGDINQYINKDANPIPMGSVKGDKKGGASGGSGGQKRNPLEGAQNAFANSYVQTADLEHQYEDLKGGTDTEFDGEAARAEGMRQASLYKTKDALRQAIQAEKDRQEEIKKSIKVEQAIRDVQDQRFKTEDQIHKDLEDLTQSYVSITTQAKDYRGELERQRRTELDILTARFNTGKANADELRQYIQLKEAINDAVRAKEAELVVDAAKDAKSANEDYYASFRSPGQQADYQGNIDLSRYQQAVKIATSLANNEKQVDDDLAMAKAQLKEETDKLAKAKTEEAKATDAIIIMGDRNRIKEDEETKAAIAALPYLKDRVRILQQEADIRKKWNGLGGPLEDWAKKAAADFNDLGASMGTVLTGAMDDFINSLVQGKVAFGAFVKTILSQLLMIIIRGLIAKAILSALGLNTAGNQQMNIPQWSPENLDYNSYVAGHGHSGMVAGGSPRFYRDVDPRIFSFAQRYHTGGIVGIQPDEVPIVAQKGEGVFTREQMKALGESSKGSNVQVNVINQTGVDADVHRQQPRFDGEKWVETIILKKMAQPGPVRDGLSAFTKR